MAGNKCAAIYLVKITKSGRNTNLDFLFLIEALVEKANHKLRDLLALWNDKRGARAMPSRADLDVSGLKPWLGNLALIDIAEDGRAVFRLCGTNLHARFGGERTRHDVSALDTEIGQSFRA